MLLFQITQMMTLTTTQIMVKRTAVQMMSFKKMYFMVVGQSRMLKENHQQSGLSILGKNEREE